MLCGHVVLIEWTYKVVLITFHIKHFVEMLLIEKSYETGDAQPMQIADYVSHAKGV